MTEETQPAIRLADYRPFGWQIDRTELTFHLSPEATRVQTRIAFRPDPAADRERFFLHGERLTLLSARIDGAEVTPQRTDQGLTCDVPDGPFVWEAEVLIDPSANTALEGLYMSDGMYCTQCEAEGFRRITYYPDRPDVLAPFHVTIHGDAPVLLSNGNPVRQEAGVAEWHDPWPKPSYLFALVAGDLVAQSDRFVTRDGREVALNVWVRPADRDKCDFALRALKAAMAWDEATYGRCYDLDVFNIVAVDDFNAGAMENKGLNIFNASYVLADPASSTDADFEQIEAVIAHEYFHNWTGNRVTCRDWFQLCLKEGLTVYRDQQFTARMRDAAVKRIDDAQLIRTAQFREDAGPLAHPVRPEAYREINNFYTVTVYEKGAEIVGMLRRLVGADGYRAAVDLYFERHDGQAVTVEDWLACFTDATGRDLGQFARWYSQSGTPRLTVEEEFADGTLTLHLAQTTPPTPDQSEKRPLHIPVAVGLLSPDGSEVRPTQLLELTEPRQSFRFPGLAERPIVSVLRDFSAPVILSQRRSLSDRALALACDTDPYNRWLAGHSLGLEMLLDRVRTGAEVDPAYLEGLRATLLDPELTPAFKARVLVLPTENEIAEALARDGEVPEPLEIHDIRDQVRGLIVAHMEDAMAATLDGLAIDAPFDPGAEQAGRRALSVVLLRYLSLRDGGTRARAAFETAQTMTLQLGALAALIEAGAAETALAQFRDRWQDDRLVMHKWFALQVAGAAPDEAVAVADRLTRDPAFDPGNPNRFRSVLGTLAQHPSGFHAPDGAGYELLIDWLIRLDPANPQLAARMVTAFEAIHLYDADRQSAMLRALRRLQAAPGLSGDTAEMVGRIIGATKA